MKRSYYQQSPTFHCIIYTVFVSWLIFYFCNTYELYTNFLILLNKKCKFSSHFLKLKYSEFQVYSSLQLYIQSFFHNRLLQILNIVPVINSIPFFFTVYRVVYIYWVSQVMVRVKNLPANKGDTKMQVQSLGQKDPHEKSMTIHSSILSRESCEHRSLAGYGPQGHKESDMTEVT